MSRPSTCGSPVIAAIDFGTTSTGYAYALIQDATKGINVDSIQTDQHWEDVAERGIEAPTTVLMDPGEKFHSFGFKAEEKYKQLTIKNQHKSWYYFKHFKMELHTKTELKRDITLTEAGGKQMRALNVFADAIRYVKKQLLDRLRASDISARDVQWVITVPAIWRESARQFMREAAKNAGIPGCQLTLALEPESAAIYCKEMALKKVGGVAAAYVRSFNPGEKYVVIDLGGGTVDTTVHEVQEDGSLKELHAATGGPWGGVMVNEEYEKLLEKIVTDEVLKEFKSEHQTEWLRMEKEFEEKKKAFSNKSEDVALYFSVDLENKYKEINGSNFQEHLKSQDWCKNRIELIKHVLMLKAAVIQELFVIATNKVCGHIRQLMRNETLKGVSTLLLVGGFSQSPIVRNEIQKKFEKLQIIAPESGDTAILKGAVMYGNDRDVIAARISPFSYGVHTRAVYNASRHSACRPIKLKDGRQVVENVFNKHLTKGKIVYVGEPQSPIGYKVSNVANREVFWKVYKSPKEDPIFCDNDNECSYLGKLTITIPDSIKDKTVSLKLSMTCKGTELEAKVSVGDHDVEVSNPTFDFLGDEVTGCDFEPMSS